MNEKAVTAIFGSADKMKIVRMFIFNPDKTFDVPLAVERLGISKARATKEIRSLAKAGLVRRKGRGFVLNKAFAYLAPLEEFISATIPRGQDIGNKMKGVGKVRLLVLAGIFIRNPESRLDMLLVGDKLKKAPLAKVLKSLESQIGKELVFSVFDTEDFKYRVAMRDKLVMDVLDFPHEKVVNKLGI